jgi:hypothetical protein
LHRANAFSICSRMASSNGARLWRALELWAACMGSSFPGPGRLVPQLSGPYGAATGAAIGSPGPGGPIPKNAVLP